MEGVGFSGTRRGTTYEQARSLYALLAALREPYDSVLQHGDCIGADAEAHALALRLGYRVIIHPPRKTTTQARCAGASFSHPPDDYLARDQRIVRDSRILVAASLADHEEIRSGTWTTVRYARRRQRPIVVVWPSGEYGLQLPRGGGTQTTPLRTILRRLGVA